MICWKCGSEVKDEYLYCTQCGAKLDESDAEKIVPDKPVFADQQKSGSFHEAEENGTDQIDSSENLQDAQEVSESIRDGSVEDDPSRLFSLQDAKASSAESMVDSREKPNRSKKKIVCLLIMIVTIVCIAALAFFNQDIGTFMQHVWNRLDKNEHVQEASTETEPRILPAEEADSPEEISEAEHELFQTESEAMTEADLDLNSDMIFGMLLGRMMEDAQEQMTAYVVTASSLNVRKGPGTDQEVLAKLSQGDICVGTGNKNEDGTWVEVEYAEDQEPGWISQEYTESSTGTRDELSVWLWEMRYNELSADYDELSAKYSELLTAYNALVEKYNTDTEKMLQEYMKLLESYGIDTE